VWRRTRRRTSYSLSSSGRRMRRRTSSVPGMRMRRRTRGRTRRAMVTALLLAFGTAVRHRSTDEAKLRTTATSHMIAALRAFQHVLTLGTPHPIIARRHHAEKTKVVHRLAPLSFLRLVGVVVRCRAALWAELRITSPARRSYLKVDHCYLVHDDAR